MDKVKKIFSPGHSKDDEVLYGNQGSQSTGQGATGSGEVPEAKEHNVLRQVLNPNGANYDQVAYGSPVTQTGAAHSSVDDTTILHTLPEAKKHEHGVLRQILNPHGDRYDEQAFGTTAVADDPNAAPQDPTQLQTLPEAKKEHNVLRQILNPGGTNYDEVAYGTTAVAGGASAEQPTQTQSSIHPTSDVTAAGAGGQAVHDTTATGALPGTAQSSVKPDSDQKSAMSIKSGVEGPYAHQANTEKAGAQPTSSNYDAATTSNISGPTSNTAGQSGESASTAFGAHFGRDAGLAGAGLAGGAAIDSRLDQPTSTTGTSGTSDLQGPWSKPNMETNVPAQGSTLSSSAGPTYEDRFQPTSTSAPENPQLNTAPSDVAQATFTARSYKLGDTSSAGTTTGVGKTAETPHVPGEFPLESGEDPHGSHIGPATAAARAAASGPGAAGFASQPPATAAQPPVTYGSASKPATAQHDHDSEAAFAGAAGAFGVGAYGVSTARDEQTVPAPEPTTTNVTVLGRNLESAGPTTGPAVPASSLQQSSQTVPVGPSQQTSQPAPVSSSQQTSQPPPTTTHVTILGRNLDSPDAAERQSGTVASTASTSAAAQPQTTTAAEREHHYGRDAALAGGAGAAGVASYDLAKHHDAPTVADPSRTVAQTSSNAPATSNVSPNAGGDAQNPASSTANSTTPQQSTQHHYGRDAAVAGGAGAVGAGVYEAAKHHGDTGPASNTVGPHKSDVANAVDPRVQPDPSPVVDKKEAKKQEKEAEKEAKAQEKAHAKELKEQEKAHEKEVKVQEKEAKKEAKAEEKARAKEEKEQEKEAKKQEKAHEKEVKAQEKEAKKEAKAEEKARAKEEKEQEKEDSHRGRDAAVAGGAGAAAGAGAYELGKDHDGTGPASKTVGPHESNVANVADPRVQPDYETVKGSTTAGPHQSGLANRLDPNVQPDAAQMQQQQTHYGRDAAVAGGAGAAGVGAYEYGKSRDDTGPASKTIGPHESNAANVVDPRVQPDPEQMKDSTTSGPHRSDLANRADPRVDADANKATQDVQGGHSSDTTRAAEAGAAGAGAGSFAEEGLQRRDTGPASKTYGPHKSNILNILDPRVKMNTQLMKEEEPLTTGPHRSDIANMLDPRVRSNADRSQRSSSEQHTGRDAALGAGAGSAAGATAYEAEQRHSDDPQKHNKLQKARPDEGSEKSSEKGEKQGFFSKILHPGRKSTEGRHSSEEAGQSTQARDSEQAHPSAGTAGAAGAATGAVTGTAGHQAASGSTAQDSNLPGGTANTSVGRDGVLIEPHTGLPMDVGKYGTYGAGGTDAAPQISGYHETDPAIRSATVGTAAGADSGHGALPGQEGVAGPDWDAVKKQNTLY